MFTVILSFAFVFLGSCSSDDPLLVTTTLGKIKGQYRTTPANVTYESYEGIPFAEPPLRSLRFRPPYPIKPWQGVISANKRKEVCWGVMPRQLEPKVFVGTEDCLYLNVYAPANRSIDHLLPVIVYIYAGAFQFSSLQGFEQNNFMDKDVIFVTFNYRHGILGFLSTEDEAVSGNMGLKDQVLALKWVKEHIRAFGGDDNSVTLIGNSAGGACVHYHYLSPLSVGLFHRGISLSSSALMPWAQAKNSRENALALGKLMNCSILDVHELVDCLRNVPARALVEVQPKFMGWRRTVFAPFGPVVEKNTNYAFLEHSPVDLLNSGFVYNVPWITGIVSEEGLMSTAEFGTNEGVMWELNNKWESIAPQLLNYYYTLPAVEHAEIARQIKRYYFGKTAISRENLNALTHLVGDRLFGADSLKAAQMQARVSTAPVWYYYFPFKPAFSISSLLSGSNKTLGTAHGDDGALVFGKIGDSAAEKNDRLMQRKLIDLWVSFAHTGRPSSQPHWQELTAEPRNFHYLEFSDPKNIRMVTNCTLAENRFWASIHFNENIQKWFSHVDADESIQLYLLK